MAQIRGTAGYNLGHQNPFGGPGSADATSDPSPLDAIREQTSKIEDWLDTMADPVKPYVYLSGFWGDCWCWVVPKTHKHQPKPMAQTRDLEACTDTVFTWPGTFPRSAVS